MTFALWGFFWSCRLCDHLCHCDLIFHCNNFFVCFQKVSNQFELTCWNIVILEKGHKFFTVGLVISNVQLGYCNVIKKPKY